MFKLWLIIYHHDLCDIFNTVQCWSCYNVLRSDLSIDQQFRCQLLDLYRKIFWKTYMNFYNWRRSLSFPISYNEMFNERGDVSFDTRCGFIVLYCRKLNDYTVLKFSCIFMRPTTSLPYIRNQWGMGISHMNSIYSVSNASYIEF